MLNDFLQWNHDLNLYDTWFQQDGASTWNTHFTSNQTSWSYYLDLDDTGWPPKSSDLNLLDYFQWPYLKEGGKLLEERLCLINFSCNKNFADKKIIILLLSNYYIGSSKVSDPSRPSSHNLRILEKNHSNKRCRGHNWLSDDALGFEFEGHFQSHLKINFCFSNRNPH